ncbi:tetratricopeptide repeat protein [Paraburkholderia bonniea]|uniref:tetratricopeptide repeat protein n=1 Tax=Paraburkholderia bonniea TaxID=2152891 RepID=UPI0025726DD1|nr:tetratricopeptide repeat protein [Paraburkholderia bonniea]WJF89143.1 tetratricopeptide repeat protein [Paraburkholderia bonniea]WJF92459.1 tetratricopeptide repeat protein [Paraburkholderia bonniea]
MVSTSASGEALRWLNLALDAHESGRLAEAQAAYAQVLACDPAHVLGWNNLANLLRQTGCLAEAEAAYRQALNGAPGQAGIHNNLGGVLEDLGHLDDAEQAYRQALALDAGFAQARFNLGLLLLAQGRYAEGWDAYEARKQIFPEYGRLPFPEWQGECLAGRSLLLLAEQGYGDTLQFVRYAAQLKALGVTQLSLVCHDTLASVLQTITALDQLITRPEALHAHDFWISLASLPRCLGTTLDTIAKTPYLSVPAEREALWRACLPPAALRVGLAWKGNAQHANDARRSLPHLSVLQPLWSIAGVQFVSLQKGASEEAEITACAAQQPMISAGSALRDFGDTAALVAQMDLVLCVDTALAHLAGALGVPCWVMLPRHGVDWRWLKAGERAPWYGPEMWLVRQGDETLHGKPDWKRVVQVIETRLRSMRQTAGDR